MMGRIVGGVLGSAIGRKKGNHPVAGAVIGAATLFASRRLFPQRYAVIAAWGAAGYLTKKWAERADARRAAEEAHAIDPELAAAGVVDPYVGADGGAAEIAPDGAMMGDALPPPIPLDSDGQRPAIH